MMRSSLLLATAFATACGSQLPDANYEAEEGQQMDAAAVTFLETVGKDLLGLRADDRLRQRASFMDELGHRHTRFDRSYRGLPVRGADLVVHTEPSQAQSLSVDFAAPMGLGVVPTLSAEDAAQLSQQDLPAPAMKLGQPSLAVWAPAEAGAARLSYEVVAEGTLADGTPSVLRTVLDAHSGEVLARYDEIHTAAAAGTGKGLYTGQVALGVNSVTGGFELRDPSRGNSATQDAGAANKVVTSTTNSFGNGQNANRQSAAVDAHYGAAVTWDYYKKVHGRNGIKNNGQGAVSRVHYGSNYNNAFWSDGCFCMTYGDGDGRLFRPLVALDVAGHEMTHGVTSATARLIYSGESGGLNEATSDIFGAMTEFYAQNPTQPGNYLVGEKVGVSMPFLRSMSDPRADNRSIDNYRLYRAGIDVHLSSGIANNFFYLLAEGGKNRTSGAQVTGIGRQKAEKIWYKALTAYMTSGTNFRGARTACINAANALYGAGSAESRAVAAAWSAVGVS